MVDDAERLGLVGGHKVVAVEGLFDDLDRLSGAALVMDLDVAGLKAGVHAVPVAANLPAGTTLVAASPASVTVTIGVAAAPVSPSPAAPATPTPSPSGS